MISSLMLGRRAQWRSWVTASVRYGGEICFSYDDSMKFALWRGERVEVPCGTLQVKVQSGKPRRKLQRLRNVKHWKNRVSIHQLPRTPPGSQVHTRFGVGPDAVAAVAVTGDCGTSRSASARFLCSGSRRTRLSWRSYNKPPRFTGACRGRYCCAGASITTGDGFSATTSTASGLISRPGTGCSPQSPIRLANF